MASRIAYRELGGLSSKEVGASEAVVRGERRVGVEVKRTSSPAMTRSMYAALYALRLERLYLVHAGTRTFDLAPAVRAVAFGKLHADLPPVG